MTHENENILAKCQEFRDQIKHLEQKNETQKDKTNMLMAKVKEDMSHELVEQASKLNTQISFLTRKHELEMQEKDHSIRVMRGDLSY